ncbi:MAG: Flp pilus assembly protein CpaB, partial [Planctomycetaceae bacterium]
MNVKSIVFALIFACSVTAGAHVLIRQSRMEPPPKPTKQVVRVAQQIERGQSLTKKELKLVKVDADAIPPGAVLDFKTALGRAARSTILPGILLETQLMQQGGSGLPALIPVGFVAHTIKVPGASSGLLPFLRPKDRIDVQLILNAQGASAGHKARVSRVVPLLNNVEVLAVGTRLSDYLDEEDGSKSKKSSDSKSSSIALLLTKHQSMQLGLGESKGELLITL